MRKLAPGVATAMISLPFAALILPANAAVAAPAPATEVVPYSGSASAYLAHVELLRAALVPGLLDGDLVDVALTTAEASMDSTGSPSADAVAKNLDVALLSDAISVQLQEAHQSAPPTTDGPMVTEIAGVDGGSLLNAHVGTLTAHAQDASTAYPAVNDPISSATSQLADLNLLTSDLPQVDAVEQTAQQLDLVQQTEYAADAAQFEPAALLDLAVATSTARTELTGVEGQSSLGLQATSTVEASEIKLFEGGPLETRIGIASAPTLTAVAAGTDASSLQYNAPLLSVTVPGGNTIELSAQGPAINIPILAGLVNIQLTLAGIEEQTITPTEVTGSASLLRVALSVGLPDPAGLAANANDPTASTQLAPVTLFDVTIGEQHVRAAVPEGGVPVPETPGEDNPQPNPGVSPPMLAETNASTDPVPYLIVGTILLALGTTLTVVASKRRSRRTESSG